ncbi:MAG: pyrroline-5-carboxylate reductase [Bacteriovoracaceae bacterium]|nr:pyrroline-5-carboxylate reductase [Bacteriovoracaceae bacterium]
MMKSLTVFGCGNMASALVRGIFETNRDLKISTYTPTKTRATELANVVSGIVLDSLDEIPHTDAYLIACKPQQFDELSENLKLKLPPESFVISIMAGVPTSVIKAKLGAEKLVRVMPNTPTLVGEGISLMYFNESITVSEKEGLTKLFSDTSKVYTFSDEEMIEKLSGLTASGPAYVFEIARIVAAIAENYGVDKDSSNEMAKQLLFGSSKMMSTSEFNPEELREQVTSKNGITYEALKVFQNEGLEPLFSKAIGSAYKRAKELGK